MWFTTVAMDRSHLQVVGVHSPHPTQFSRGSGPCCEHGTVQQKKMDYPVYPSGTAGCTRYIPACGPPFGGTRPCVNNVHIPRGVCLDIVSTSCLCTCYTQTRSLSHKTLDWCLEWALDTECMHWVDAVANLFAPPCPTYRQSRE